MVHFNLAVAIVSPQKCLANHSLSLPMAGAQTKYRLFCFKVQEGLAELGWEQFLDKRLGPRPGAIHSRAGVRVSEGNEVLHDDTRRCLYVFVHLPGDWGTIWAADGKTHPWSTLVSFRDDNFPRRIFCTILVVPKHGL
jgi:hypothetical protein